MRYQFNQRIFRAMAFISLGGAVFQTTGCNDTVRDAVLQGLETTSITLSNIFIQALFQGLGEPVGI